MRNKKQNVSNTSSRFSWLRQKSLALLIIAAVVAGTGLVMPHARADEFDDQINALRQQNASAQSSLNALLDQASSYQDAINQLQAQIDSVRAAIAENQAKQADLQAQIEEQQREIDKQKGILSDSLKSTYVNGQLTPVEMLATSSNLSDYIDKQEANSRVQDQIQKTMAQIKELQRSLQAKKAEIDQLLESQQAQNEQLSAAQAKQNEMLAYNEGQQNAFNSQIASNSSRISELRRQQAILNAKYNIGNFRGDPGNGGYPSVWANAGQDTMIDSWGMYNRECVSYTAFMVHQDYINGINSRDMPWWGGIGNANQWDDNAIASGIPVDSNPTPHSIAISNAGFYGHAMYVEAVNGNQIYVRQYNAQLNGQYSEGWRYTTGLVFLHF
jgi:peptidoglycan hydrolase CwlO-like protein